MPLVVREVSGNDLEALAVSNVEMLAEQYRLKAWISALAYVGGDGQLQRAANIYACSEREVRRLAGVFLRWGADYLNPDFPLGLYEIAEKTDDPLHWFRMATDLEYREGQLGRDDGRGIWSIGDLQDAADVASGRTVSRVPWFKGRGPVSWADGRIVLEPPSEWRPSGDRIDQADVLIREVLNAEAEEPGEPTGPGG